MQSFGGRRVCDRRFRGRYGQPGLEGAAQRVADYPARLGVQDHRETGGHGDLGDVSNPKLVRPHRHDSLGQVREDPGWHDRYRL